MRECSVPECGNPHYSRGLCNLHYQRWRKYGSVELPADRRRPGWRHAERTHCPQGHEYTPENTYIHRGSRSCVECKRLRNRAYRSSGDPRVRVSQRKARLKANFGMTPEEFDRVASRQRDVCAACQQPETWRDSLGRVRSLSVDHDHETGEVRELLCARCNTILGLVVDDPDILESLMAYLRRHRLRAVDANLPTALAAVSDKQYLVIESLVAGLSMDEAAQRAGVHSKTVSKWKRKTLFQDALREARAQRRGRTA